MRPLLAAVAVLLLLPAGAAAQEPVIPPGAKAAGLDLGGQTLSQAAATLDAAFAAARRPADRVPRRRPSLHASTRRRSASASTRSRTARRAYDAAIATPPAPDGTYPVDVPLHVTYDGDKLAAFTRGARPRLGRPPAQRAAEDDDPAHEGAPRAHGLVDRREGARARRSTRCSPTRGPPAIVRVERVRVHPKVNVIDLRKQHRAVADHRPRRASSCATSRTSSCSAATGSPSARPASRRRPGASRSTTRPSTRPGARPTSRGPAPTATRSSRAARRTTR